MEKKTIGGFISALRRAKGMTQRELAEKLNVSDKAVSRWERDECAPDLLLIPVLADIFGVTSDEILRGERRQNDVHNEENISSGERSEKALKAIFARKKLNFMTITAIVYFCVTLGLIMAMILNFAVNRSALAFFIGSLFIVAGGFVLSIAYKNQIISLEGDELPEGLVSDFRRYIINSVRNCLTSIIAAFMLILPYLFVAISYGSYFGLTFFTWLIFGGISALISVIACRIVFYFAVFRDVDKGRYLMSDAELSKIREKIVKIKQVIKNQAIVTAFLVVVLIILWTVMQKNSFFPKRTFNSFDELQNYINEINEDIHGSPVIDDDSNIENIPLDKDEELTDKPSSSVYNNAVVIMVKNKNNETVGYIVDKYRQIYRWEVDNEDTCLPITVWTHYATHKGEQIAYIVTAWFVIMYVLVSFLINSKMFQKNQDKKGNIKKD